MRWVLLHQADANQQFIELAKMFLNQHTKKPYPGHLKTSAGYRMGLEIYWQSAQSSTAVCFDEARHLASPASMCDALRSVPCPTKSA